MTSEQSINPQALTSEQYALYAAGYLSASAQVQEVALQQGKDFDQEMILVFLHSGAELRVAHAKQLAAREYEVRRSLEEVSPRPLGCGFCFEEDGEEIHPHPDCPVGADAVWVERSDLARLQKHADMLVRLQAAGVDNWEGYSRAFTDEDGDPS
jgi:hypothetical protein